MNTARPSPQLNPTVITMVTLIDLLQIRVTKTTLRDYFFGLPNYPRLNLADVSQALTKLNVKNSGLTAAKDLTNTQLPAVTQISEMFEILRDGKEEPESIKIGVMVVITKMIGDEVIYLHPGKGEIKEKLNSFYKKWNNILLVPKPNESTGEDSYEEKKNLEILSNEEYRKTIKLYYNFISRDECEKIVSYCDDNNLFDRSGVGFGRGTFVTNARTSFSAKIKDRNLFRSVFDKVSQALNCPVNHIESLQCVRYNPGQEYRPHFDSGGDTIRKATMLVYLNDNFMGGETYFPEIDHKVPPKMGSCLYFKNLDDNLNILPQSVHAGLPVTSGIKYACNIWISPTPLKV